MNKKNLSIVMTLLLLAPLSAWAGGEHGRHRSTDHVNVNEFSIGYAFSATEYSDFNDATADGSGFRFQISQELPEDLIGENFYVTGRARLMDFDGGGDLTTYDVGIGFRYSILTCIEGTVQDFGDYYECDMGWSGFDAYSSLNFGKIDRQGLGSSFDETYLNWVLGLYYKADKTPISWRVEMELALTDTDIPAGFNTTSVSSYVGNLSARVDYRLKSGDAVYAEYGGNNLFDFFYIGYRMNVDL